jgi:hypothetical protein
MTHHGVIAGRVVTSEGNPVVGNTGSATLLRYQYRTDGMRQLASVPGISYPNAAGSFQRMNDLGEFRLFGIPPGDYFLSVTGPGAVIGEQNQLYFPGVTDEAKALPIHVNAGEEIQVGTLALPPRNRGVQVKLRISGVDGSTFEGVRVYIAENLFVRSRSIDPNEIALPPVAPGHYAVVVRTDSFVQPTMFYGRLTLDVGASTVEAQVSMTPAVKINGRVVIDDGSGVLSSAPASIRCRLRSRFDVADCANAQLVPGVHELELEGLRPDMYVASAKSGNQDILKDGFDVTSDASVEIVLAMSGAIVQGNVRDTLGHDAPGAVVVLIPDAPYRNVGLRYRRVVTDPNGRFEIHGIAPGSYKLFAWTQLEEQAYRNADFMKPFEDRGTPLHLEKGSRQSITLESF